jgi:hypothetical protein
MVDDPQTTESAWSPSQSHRREAILAGDVLGMAGPGKKIAGLMACTVIRPGDMADNILDREKHPESQGERTKMVYAFPSSEKLWAKYAELRADSLRNDGDGKEATEFYVANRDAMDKGAVIAWPQRFNEDEVSAIQHAMNLRYRDEAAFFAEYQNEPIVEEIGEEMLTAAQIAAKLNGYRPGEIPIGCNHLTMFIDVQQKVLFWMLCAWEDDFTGYIMDYGAWPEQKRAYFTLRDVHSTLGRATPSAGLEGQIFSGLEKLTTEKLSRAYRREDGAELRIDRCLIDANWGQSTDVVYQFCRQSPHAGLLLPAHGKYVGASSIPFSEYKRRRGDRVGLHWRIPNTVGKRQVRHVLVDTNYWKTFVHARLAVAMGDPGYVGAHIHVNGRHWAVARPIGAGNRHYAAVDATVEDLLEAKSPDNDYDRFRHAVSEACFGGLPVRDVPRTGQAIDWLQILAWCARDQEARYQEHWQWRSPRSNHDTPQFNRPKIDGLFVMRVLLGLYIDKEAKIEKQLAELEAEAERLTNGTAKARQEPQYWHDQRIKELKQHLDVDDGLPLEAGDLFEPSLSGRVANRQEEIVGRIATLHDADKELAHREYRLRSERAEVHRRLSQCMEALKQHEQAAAELQEALDELEKDKGEDFTEPKSIRRNLPSVQVNGNARPGNWPGVFISRCWQRVTAFPPPAPALSIPQVRLRGPKATMTVAPVGRKNGRELSDSPINTPAPVNRTVTFGTCRHFELAPGM